MFSRLGAFHHPFSLEPTWLFESLFSPRQNPLRGRCWFALSFNADISFCISCKHGGHVDFPLGSSAVLELVCPQQA